MKTWRFVKNSQIVFQVRKKNFFEELKTSKGLKNVYTGIRLFEFEIWVKGQECHKTKSLQGPNPSPTSGNYSMSGFIPYFVSIYRVFFSHAKNNFSTVPDLQMIREPVN